MQVKEVMHSGMEWVAPDTLVPAIAQKMRDLDIGAIPVCEQDRPIGMVTDRDIACRAIADGRDVSSLTARDVMTAGVICCRDSEELDDVVHVMEDKQVRRLPAVDKDGTMVGMLSLGDVSHKVRSSFQASS